MVPEAKSRAIEATSLVVALAAMAFLLHWGVAERFDQIDYLLRDQAHYLFSAQQILEGRVPYRDFFWNYGPIPLYSYSIVGYIWELGPRSFLVHQAFWNFAAASLCLLWMRRWFGLAPALATFVVTSFFWMTTPDTLCAPMERVVVIVIAGLWRSPGDRGWVRGVLVGGLLGLLQGIKFGTACALGLAWMLVDILWLVKMGGLRPRWRGWLASLGQICAGFLAVMSMWVVGSLLSMDTRAAAEFLLPLYHLKWYHSYVTTEDRWFKFLNWGYFFGLQLRFIVCALVAAGFAGWYFARKEVSNAACAMGATGADSRRPPMGPLLLALCYGVGCVFIFRHVYNLIAYGWLLAPVVGFALISRRWVIRLVVVLALLPSTALLPLGIVRQFGARKVEAATGIPYVSAAGNRLFLKAEDAASLRDLEMALSASPQAERSPQPGLILGPKYLGGLAGSGYHWILAIPPATRNTWFFPGAIADSELETEFRRSRLARFIAIKTDGAKTDVERRALAIRALPFAEHKNIELLSFFSRPVATPTGWLIFWRRP